MEVIGLSPSHPYHTLDGENPRFPAIGHVEQGCRPQTQGTTRLLDNNHFGSVVDLLKQPKVG